MIILTRNSKVIPAVNFKYQSIFDRKDGISHRNAKTRWVGNAQIRFRFQPVASSMEIKQRKLNSIPAIPKDKKTRKSSHIILFFLRYSSNVSPATISKNRFTTKAGEVRNEPGFTGLPSKRVV